MQLKFFLICICTLTLFSNTFPASGQESKRFSWNGAIKTRMQGDYQTGNQAANRFVYGFFLNGTLRLTERIDVIGRLMSGNNRKIASSGWLNYSDLFVPKSSLISWDVRNLQIRRMYARLRLNPSLTLIAGKQPLPFFRPTQLIMDKDLAPEGFIQQFLFKNNDKSASWGLNLGQLMINQLASPVKNLEQTYFFAAQAVARFTQPSRSQALAIAYYTVTRADSFFASQNLISPSPIVAANSNRPNSDQSGYLSEFRLINLSAQYSQTLKGWPLTFNADYVFNTGADDMQQGITGSVMYGSMEMVGGTRAGVQAFFIEQDATFAPFSNVDYTQTNSIGIGFLLGRQIIEKLAVDIALYTRKYDSPTTLPLPVANNAWRTRFRLVFNLQLN